MDYVALAEGLSKAVPFNTHIGLRTTEIGPGFGIVVLPEGQSTANHVGTQHAGALFSAGEAASGGAFIGAFGDKMGEITPLAESAEIAYLKLARGDITATGRLEREREELLAELEREGRVRFPVAVELTDPEGTVVAEMTVRWYVRRRA